MVSGLYIPDKLHDQSNDLIVSFFNGFSNLNLLFCIIGNSEGRGGVEIVHHFSINEPAV